MEDFDVLNSRGPLSSVGLEAPAPEPENQTRGERGARKIEPYFSTQFNEHTVQFGSFTIAFRHDTSSYTVKCPFQSDPQAGIRCTKSRKVQFQKGDTHQNVVKRMMHWCLAGLGKEETKASHQQQARRQKLWGGRGSPQTHVFQDFFCT